MLLVGLYKLALGDRHSIIVDAYGSVWSTAIALRGLEQSHSFTNHFVKVIPEGVMAAAAGIAFSIVVKQGGGVWAMGRNYKGQLGDGTRVRKGTFFFVQMIPGAKAVAAGGAHSMILTQGGRVWATGWNKYGQLGDGSTSDSIRFRQAISSGTKTVAAAAGDIHTILMKENGSIWAAGRNYNGQLGDGTKFDRSNFLQVLSGGGADVAAGGDHSMVLHEDGSVWTTGWNGYGQLGDGSQVDRLRFVQVVSGGAKAIAAGSRHSMMLKEDGSLWATGYNLYGQLGDGSAATSFVFVQVISSGVTEIAAGALHSMLVKKDGSIWGAGSSKDGQLGAGVSNTFEKNFVRLAPFENGLQQDHIFMPFLFANFVLYLLFLCLSVCFHFS